MIKSSYLLELEKREQNEKDAGERGEVKSALAEHPAAEQFSGCDGGTAEREREENRLKNPAARQGGAESRGESVEGERERKCERLLWGERSTVVGVGALRFGVDLENKIEVECREGEATASAGTDGRFEYSVEQFEDAEREEQQKADDMHRLRGEKRAEQPAREEREGEYRSADSAQDEKGEFGDFDAARTVGDSGDKGVEREGEHQQQRLPQQREKVQGSHRPFFLLSYERGRRSDNWTGRAVR